MADIERILIVGGGIAGLSLATALHRQGFHPELIERSAANLSAPVTGSLVTEIATRFGLVVSERSAASAFPVLGAFGGATVNMIFMNHFQQIALGHFTVRRLEREYGAETVRLHYAELAARGPKARK